LPLISPLTVLLTVLPITAQASPGLDALSAGDEARYAGNRAAAAERYKEAAASGEPEAEAMARLRLLSLSGNLGALWHGPALDAALRAGEGPWGELAWVDFHLMAPAFAGAKPAEAIEGAEALLEVLPGPAAARLYLATGDPQWLARLREAEDRDGLGEGMLTTGRRAWPDPGTWFLGLGASGAPGLGVGGGVIFQHPDLAWRRIWFSTAASVTTRGNLAGSVSLRTPGRFYGEGAAAGWRSASDFYVEGEDGAVTREVYVVSGGRIQAGPGVRLPGPGEGRTRISATAQLRVDLFGDQRFLAPGPGASLSWSTLRGTRGDRRGLYLGASGDVTTFGDYPHAGLFLDARGFAPGLAGALGGRLTLAGELADQAPIFRLPTAGGAVLHRGAWAGRWRAPWIATADLEHRWTLGATLEPVVFANVAWVADAGLHPGGGLGIRLVLPPENLNVVRLDVAVSDTAWGVYAGWGEAF
jgi:hypothetical protein